MLLLFYWSVEIRIVPINAGAFNRSFFFFNMSIYMTGGDRKGKMMQSAAVAAKGGVPGLHFPGRGNRVSVGFGVVGKRTAGSNRLWMPDRGFCGGSSRLGSSIGFGVEMARMRSGMEGIFRSREKARYVRVQASGSFFPHRLFSIFTFFIGFS